MKSIVTLSVITILAALALAGCGQNPEGNLAGASSTNSSASVGGTNTPPVVNTNLPADTNK